MRFQIVVVSAFAIIFATSCGVNIFSPLSSKDYEEANLYQSRNLLDQGRYAELLSNAQKYPPQDHVAAALGIMGFDIKILTNIVGNNSNTANLLLSWIDKNDLSYVIDLAWGIKRLRDDLGGSVTKSITLTLGGASLAMLGLFILADRANTNAINTQDGFSEDEINVLSHWLSNPPQNTTNLFVNVGTDREGNSYTIAKLIGTGTISFLQGMSLFIVSNVSNLSSTFGSLDGNNDGIVDDTEVSNFIQSFLSNLLTNI